LTSDREQNSRNANTVPAWVNELAQLLLQLQWSPEQIARQRPNNHETVYKRVYTDKTQEGTLWRNLR
jgi:IS30 family transposase